MIVWVDWMVPLYSAGVCAGGGGQLACIPFHTHLYGFSSDFKPQWLRAPRIWQHEHWDFLKSLLALAQCHPPHSVDQTSPHVNSFVGRENSDHYFTGESSCCANKTREHFWWAIYHIARVSTILVLKMS